MEKTELNRISKTAGCWMHKLNYSGGIYSTFSHRKLKTFFTKMNKMLWTEEDAG